MKIRVIKVKIMQSSAKRILVKRSLVETEVRLLGKYNT